MNPPEELSTLDADGLPREVAGPSDCQFNKFAWQDFLALTRPDPSGEMRFENWTSRFELLGLEAPTSTGDQAPPPPPLQLLSYVEAGPTPPPLVDQNGSWTYFHQRVNPNAADFLQQCGLLNPDCTHALVPTQDLAAVASGSAAPKSGPYPIRFPNQSVLVKESWKVLTQAEQASGRFHQRTAALSPARVGGLSAPVPSAGYWSKESEETVGLVALHVVHMTPKYRSWVWATFEHVDNAPSCADVHAGKVKRKYSYFDPDCLVNCKARKEHPDLYNPALDCAKLCGELNVYHNNACEEDSTPVPPSTPKSTLDKFACGSLDASPATHCLSSSGCFDGSLPGYFGGYSGGGHCFRWDNCKTAEYWVSGRSEPCRVTIPTQLCRAWPSGLRLGEDAFTIDPSLAELNDNIRALLKAQGSVWQHYRLVGVQWGTPKKSAQSGAGVGWSGDMLIQGDPLLMNAVVEPHIQGRDVNNKLTYEAVFKQVKAKGSGGCLGCHGTAFESFGWGTFKGVNFLPWRQTNFSHVLDYLGHPRWQDGSAETFCEKMRTEPEPGRFLQVAPGDLTQCTENDPTDPIKQWCPRGFTQMP